MVSPINNFGPPYFLRVHLICQRAMVAARTSLHLLCSHFDLDTMNTGGATMATDDQQARSQAPRRGDITDTKLPENGDGGGPEASDR